MRNSGTFPADFCREKHIQYFLHNLNCLPEPYSGQDSNRLTILYFCVSGLDLLGALDALSDTHREHIVDWIYSLFLFTPYDEKRTGFRGSLSIASSYQQQELKLQEGEQELKSQPVGQELQLQVNEQELKSQQVGQELKKEQEEGIDEEHLDCAHVTMSYAALATLRILGDDLQRLTWEHRRTMVAALRELQVKNGEMAGCLSPTSLGAEKDMRFLYCAAVVLALLSVANGDSDGSGGDVSSGSGDVSGGNSSGGDVSDNGDKSGDVSSGSGGNGKKTVNPWSSEYGFSKQLALSYVQRSRNYDFAFGHCPGLESHSGSTYCAVSALQLMLKYDPVDEQHANTSISQELQRNEQQLAHWLLARQQTGFQGRPHKDDDTCYSFWVGATLAQLGAVEFVDHKMSFSFTMSCQQQKTGGFSKVPNAYPDVLHSYMALSGLSLMGYPGLATLVPELGITTRAAQKMILNKS